MQTSPWHIRTLNPNDRFLARKHFYEATKLTSYFRFEAAFLRWENRRGVFSEESGSLWWKKVNERLIYSGERALAIWQKDPPPVFHTKSVVCWLAFIENPSPKHWYRAHNASILEGYEYAKPFLKEETKDEQTFILTVKYRLLFAQKLIEEKKIFLRQLADPRSSTLEFLMPLSFLYPPHYPNTVTFGQKQWARFKNLLELPSLEELEAEAEFWNS